MRRRRGPAFLQQPQDDGRGRKGDQKTAENTDLDALSPQKGNQDDGAYSQADLQAAAEKDRFFEARQRVARQFHADGEQQQGDADIRQHIDGVSIRDDAQQRGTAQNAGEQKSHRGGQAQTDADGVDEDGKQKKYNNFVEKGYIHDLWPHMDKCKIYLIAAHPAIGKRFQRRVIA